MDTLPVPSHQGGVPREHHLDGPLASCLAGTALGLVAWEAVEELPPDPGLGLKDPEDSLPQEPLLESLVLGSRTRS